MATDKSGGPATHKPPSELVNDADAADRDERKPIETKEDLGAAFVRRMKADDEGKEAFKAGRFKPGANDPFWSIQPIELDNGWHRDEKTKWNFSVFEGRLYQAATDEQMKIGVR